MQLFINTANRQFVSDPAFQSRVARVDFKRGDAAQIDLVFVAGNAPVELATGALIRLGIKASGKYDGDFLVFENSYNKSGTTYTIAPSFNTQELNDILASGDGNDSNDVPFHDAMLEITWSEDNGTTWTSSETLLCRIINDVIKGEENAPTTLPNPEDWLDEQLTSRAVRFDVEQSLTELQKIQAQQNIGLHDGPLVDEILTSGGLDVGPYLEEAEKTYLFELTRLSGGPIAINILDAAGVDTGGGNAYVISASDFANAPGWSVDSGSAGPDVYGTLGADPVSFTITRFRIYFNTGTFRLRIFTL
jgi:hypothetical protein